MNATQVIRRLHEHRQWVNRGLLEAAGGLSDEQLRKEFSIGQGSLWRTLLHLYAAEYVWLEALRGNAAPLVPGDAPDLLPGNQQGKSTIGSLSALVEHWAALDRGWQHYLERLTQDELDRPVAKRSTSVGKGNVYETSAADVLLHVCTHAQYTAAQAVNMLRQLGVEPLPEVMLIALARQQAQN